MSSTLRKTLAGAIAGVAVASAIAAPAAGAPGDEVPPPPSSIAMSAGAQYEELRDTGDRAPVAAQPALDEPAAASGFDWQSAGIGAAAGAGLLLVLAAFLTVGGLAGRRRDRTLRA